MAYLVRGSVLTAFSSLVEALGGDPAKLLSAYGLPADIETHPEQFASFRQTVALFEHCAERLNCPDFGIRLAYRQGLPVFGPVAVLVRNTGTVHDAFEAIGRYMHVVTPGVRIWLERRHEQDFVRLHIAVTEPGLAIHRQLLELLMANGTLIARMLTGEKVHATRMHFPHPRLARPDRYREAYGCDVYFDQSACAVDIPNALMQRAVLGADRDTARLATEYLESQQNEGSGSMQAQVTVRVRRLLATGECRLDTIAESLGQHPRTLQRRLSAEGTEFARIVDQQRRELAREYLSRPQIPLSQIVGLLGYAEQTTFNRACRRWFGKSPTALRRRPS